MKNFAVVHERVSLQFRAEAYNVFNHAQFNNPNMTASDRAYGQSRPARMDGTFNWI